MAQKKQDLFQWNRRSGPSGAKHGKKKNSIQDWIKRVQDASEDAVQEVFGGDILGPDSLKEIVPDDEALYEAQELLDGWLKDTSLPHLDKELHYKSESWASTTGLLLNDEDLHFKPDHNDNTALRELTKKYLGGGDDVSNNIPYRNEYAVATSHTQADPCERLYSLSDIDDEDIDDTLLVQDVLHGMLSKDFTRNVDLGMKPLEMTAKNPVPRMELRHEQVKVRGEKRRQKNLTKKKEKLTGEEIAQKAKERVVHEERQRIQRENVEEKAILSEMEKIKRELAEEKQRREEEMQRKKKILDEAKLQMQMELRKQKEEEERRRRGKVDAKRQAQKEMDEEVIRDLKLKMKILHKYFTAWYNVVLETRLSVGKANAIADWKCKIRAWNAWKAYVACVKSNQQAKEIEKTVKEKYRKEQMSVSHSNKTLVRKCFSSWCRYTRYKTEKNMLRLEHEEKAKKMALFLEAASKGDLWGDKSPDKVRGEAEDELEANPLSVEREDSFDFVLKKKHVNNEHSATKKLKAATSPTQSKETSRKNCQSNTKDKLVMPQHATCLDRREKAEERKSTNKKPVNHTKNVETINTTSTGVGIHGNSRFICREEEGITETRNTVNKSNLNRNVSKPDVNARFVNESSVNGNAKSVNPSDDGKLFTDRSDVSCVSSQVSSAASRKPQIRSGRQTTKPLHLAMEERQKERNIRKAAVEEERKKREEERLEVLRAKEAERLKQEQLAKEEQVKQRREEKKLEALKVEEKEFQSQQLRVKNQISKQHYEKVLLHKYGLEPLSRLVQVARLNVQIAVKYHGSLLQRVCLVEWHVYVSELSHARREKADQCYHRILLKRTFRSWMKCRFHLQNMNKIAGTHSLRLVVKHAFTAWQEYVTDQRILTWAKESNAEEHDTKRMLTKYLRTWKEFVKMEKEEREREFRRDEWRKKVQSWLPDYKGGAEIT